MYGLARRLQRRIVGLRGSGDLLGRINSRLSAAPQGMGPIQVEADDYAAAPRAAARATIATTWAVHQRSDYPSLNNNELSDSAPPLVGG